MLLRVLATVGALLLGHAVDAASWDNTLAEARGQTVYFNAWAGIRNQRLPPVGRRPSRERHGVKLEHVKLTDTAEAVRRVVAEKAAGRRGRPVDLVWINGENFLSMKREGLLFGPFAEGLPNFHYVDAVGKPTTQVDFSEPVDGLEAPWGMAQFILLRQRRGRRSRRARRAARMGEAQSRPLHLSGAARLHGTTFLKHVLIELRRPARRARASRDQADVHGG